MSTIATNDSVNDRVKKEFSGKRSLIFSEWIRNRLPASNTGFYVTNQDWIFWNWKTRKLMLCEEKCFKANLSTAFTKLIKGVIEPALKEFCPKNNIDFRGYHFIQFENTSPEDGKIFFDGIEISKEELIKFLSME